MKKDKNIEIDMEKKNKAKPEGNIIWTRMQQKTMDNTIINNKNMSFNSPYHKKCILQQNGQRQIDLLLSIKITLCRRRYTSIKVLITFSKVPVKRQRHNRICNYDIPSLPLITLLSRGTYSKNSLYIEDEQQMATTVKDIMGRWSQRIPFWVVFYRGCR